MIKAAIRTENSISRKEASACAPCERLVRCVFRYKIALKARPKHTTVVQLLVRLNGKALPDIVYRITS